MQNELSITIDGDQPISAETVAAVSVVCDTAEDLARTAARGVRLVVAVAGSAGVAAATDLPTGLISKWERAVHRIERLPVPTIATADGDIGGTALDALLATDYRVVTGRTRLILPLDGGAAWPGMALYRLARQGASSAEVRRAVLFGAPIDAAAALSVRLVQEVTDDIPAALAAFGQIAGTVVGTELAIRRQLLLDAPAVAFDEALGAHLAACDRAARRSAAWAA